MQLHSLIKVTTRSKKRLGQGHGSGRVKTSGRGTKGQNARSKRPLQFEGGALPLTKRLPFLRGKDRNKPLKAKPLVINLSDLEKIPDQTVINFENLVKYGLVSKGDKSRTIKLLGFGKVEKSFKVNISASQAAIKKLEKAGGTYQA